MDLNESALRNWVLRFYCLSLNDQEKIKSNLTRSEREKLDELLTEVKAFGIDENTSIIDEVVSADKSNLDITSTLLSKTTEVISPFWYVLISAKFFSEISLNKKPSYFKDYLQYKESLQDFKLAPKMQATLDMYFREKVINEYEK
ncbi:hypothetical protein [Acinetobacter sp. 3657]|uniref:hypothetical protein n=1 Tax=Acinetobacter sp. 3657 TaxID=2817764 RepID=UPI002864626F|nr:aspartate aminotransferase-like enzyme [Prolinoborus sp. 3657]